MRHLQQADLSSAGQQTVTASHIRELQMVLAPVTMKVTYYLDGKEISADQLAGKSGKVKIRFDYTNNLKKTITVNGKSKQAYVPFTMITGMIFRMITSAMLKLQTVRL